MTVDLEALGLLPEPMPGGTAPKANGGYARRTSELTPASIQIQRQFERLMALAGVHPRRGGQELARCPWPDHPDRDPSCSVNWPAAVFNCKSTECGAGGGIGALKRLLGEHRSPARRSARPGVAKVRVAASNTIDIELERSRLVSGMKLAGLVTFNRRTGRARFEEVQECHRAWRMYECDNGHRRAQTFSCGFQLCPVCVSSRLRADFLKQREEDHLPDRLSLSIVTPPDGMTRDEMSNWFKRLRRRHLGAVAYVHGIRMTVGQPDILLVVDADQMPASLVADSAVTLVAADVDFDHTVAWYCERFLEEVTSWRTPEQLLELLAAVKGRRRFQGCGKSYGKGKEKDGDEQLLTGEQSEEPKKVYKASGGSAKGGSKAVPCEVCGQRMRFVGIALSREDAKAWEVEGRGPPPRAPAHA